MNKTNFSKYLEQRDRELHDQMLNEIGLENLYNYGRSAVGVAKKVASGVAGVTDKIISKGNELNKKYFPSQIRKDGKWVDKPAEPQAAPAPAPAPATKQQGRQVTQQQATPTTKQQKYGNFLKSFKILYRAVNGSNIDDKSIDSLEIDKIIKYYDKLKKIPTFDKFNELYKQYSGKDFADPKKWYGNSFKKRIEFYEIIKDLVTRGVKSKSYKVVKNDNSDDDFTPDFSDFNPSAGEFGRGKNSAYEHHNLTFKNWFDQRLTLEISDPNFRKLALYRNKQSLCVDKPKYFQNQIEIEKLKGANANQKHIQDMQYNIDQCKVRCDALNSNDGSKNIG